MEGLWCIKLLYDNDRYSKIKYFAIMMITAGIVMATMASAQQMVSLC